MNNYFIAMIVILSLIIITVCMRIYYISQNPRRDKLMGYVSSLALPIVMIIGMLFLCHSDIAVTSIWIPLVLLILWIYLLWDLREEYRYTKLVREEKAFQEKMKDLDRKTRELVEKNNRN